MATTGGMRSPRFRRVPFVRDVALDPGRATVPRISAPHMLPSTILTASAPATSGISWLNPTPHTITVYASPWSSPPTTQHSLPGGRYPLPGPDFHRLDRASFAWRTKIVLLATAAMLALGSAVSSASAQSARPVDPSQQARDTAAWQHLARYYAAHAREATAQLVAARERAAAKASQGQK